MSYAAVLQRRLKPGTRGAYAGALRHLIAGGAFPGTAVALYADEADADHVLLVVDLDAPDAFARAVRAAIPRAPDLVDALEPGQPFGTYDLYRTVRTLRNFALRTTLISARRFRVEPGEEAAFGEWVERFQKAIAPIDGFVSAALFQRADDPTSYLSRFEYAHPAARERAHEALVAVPPPSPMHALQMFSGSPLFSWDRWDGEQNPPEPTVA